MNYKVIEDMMVDLSTDPFNPEKNFWIGIEYERIGQTTSAFSFYLRTAEYGIKTHPLFVYTSLLKMAGCLEKQNNRHLSVTNNLLQAMSYMPSRPEAYFLYSRFNERIKNWQECYSFADVGLTLNEPRESLPAFVEYPGKYGFMFEKAVSGWWLGREQESKELFLKLKDMDEVDYSYRSAIINNIHFLKIEDSIDPLEPVITNYRKFFGAYATNIIDIGTRDGDDANYIAKKLYAKNTIAFDASPNAARLTKLKYPWMDVRQLAVSDFEGTIEFYEVESNNKEIAGWSSLAFKEYFNSDNSKCNKIIADCVRMDSILDDGIIDVVKIDVEGFTWQVLNGFGHKLKNIKLFHLETEKNKDHESHALTEEITNFMKSNNFYLADISYEWGSNVEDQVWINKDLALYHKDCFNNY